MKTSARTSILLMILFTVGASLLGTQTSASKLPAKYKLWLDEEVLYIITPVEKQVFLDLASDREREFFIEAFWRHRDASPETEKNEFRDEHYRRIAYANKHFIGSGRPGWKTDRGKIYVILGEPRSIRPYGGTDAVLPCEVWSYQGIAIPGLAQEFDLVFFQRNRVGDHVLYQPAGDGPWSLLTNFKGSQGDYVDAYNTLYIIEPDLARTSLSLIPNESVRSYPSLTSMALLQSLDSAAYRKVEDLWARKFKEFKSLVDVEYSANYIESGAQLQVLQDAAGITFVHVSIEPKNISVAGGDAGVSTDLVLNGMLTDAQGRAVYQFERKIPLRFSLDQFEKVRQRPFSFTEVFPVVPGEYKLSVLLKNGVSKEFTSLEGTIKVPASFPAPRLTPLLLAFNAARLAAVPAGPKPFVVRDFQLYSQAEASFTVQDRLHVYTQAVGLGPELKASGSLEFLIEQNGVKKESKILPLAGNPDALNFIEVFPAAKLPPGYYRASVSLRDAAGKVLDRQAKDFMITPATALPRPWVIGQSLLESAGPAGVGYVLGLQLSNLGDPAAALPWLEKAYRASPGSRDYAADLGRVLLALSRPAEAMAVLAPLAPRLKSDYDLALLTGRAQLGLGRFDEAARTLSEALDSFGLTVPVLNALGDSRLGQNDAKEALTAWKKSLELQPDQPAVQAKVEALEKKEAGA